MRLNTSLTLIHSDGWYGINAFVGTATAPTADGMAGTTFDSASMNAALISASERPFFFRNRVFFSLSSLRTLGFDKNLAASTTNDSRTLWDCDSAIF